MVRPFRFACQYARQNDEGIVAVARRAEAFGFDVVSVSDHVGPGLAPMVALGAVAEATSDIRLGTFVLNATMRNPVQLAWEVSTLDRLSQGRVELGLGAGHTPHEYDQTGIERRSAAQRKADLAEQTEIIRALLDGHSVDHDGAFHRLRGAQIEPATQDRVPILVGGNGRALLEHAGAHADIVGLQGLGRTLDDGHRHEVKWTAEHLDAQLAQVQRGAGERFGDLELNALVQVVQVTEDRLGATRALIDRVDGLTMEQADEIPYVLIGTIDEIVAKLDRCRERWGISYFTVRELDDFAPVIDALRGR